MKQTGSFMRLITTGAFGRSTSEATSEHVTATQKQLDVGSNLLRCDLRLMGRELAIGLQDQNQTRVHLGCSVPRRKRLCVGYGQRDLEVEGRKMIVRIS